jgi:NAD(P)-dependent dehydrogenase (short-subunit alcohol dehydrogenase family)
VRAYFLYAQAAHPHLARGRGCMIHIASDAGIWGEQSIGLYSVSKAAVVMLGKMLALDAGPDGVRSNVLCPGDTWPGCGTWPRRESRAALRREAGRSRRSAGSASPATSPPRRSSTPATRRTGFDRRMHAALANPRHPIHRYRATEANPIDLVRPGAPAFLLMHGDDDRIIPPAQTLELHQALRTAGADSTRYLLAGAGHGRLALSRTQARQWTSVQVMTIIKDFLGDHLHG